MDHSSFIHFRYFYLVFFHPDCSCLFTFYVNFQFKKNCDEKHIKFTEVRGWLSRLHFWLFISAQVLISGVVSSGSVLGFALGRECPKWINELIKIKQNLSSALDWIMSLSSLCSPNSFLICFYFCFLFYSIIAKKSLLHPVSWSFPPYFLIRIL